MTPSGLTTLAKDPLLEQLSIDLPINVKLIRPHSKVGTAQSDPQGMVIIPPADNALHNLSVSFFDLRTMEMKNYYPDHIRVHAGFGIVSP